MEVDTLFEVAVVFGGGEAFELETVFARAPGVDAEPDFDLETVFEVPAVFVVDAGL
ncbi:MAG: hypothetical protein WBF06_11655 [Candidatus Acidiferrales bacterium]